MRSGAEMTKTYRTGVRAARIAGYVLAIMLVTSAAWAADVDGKWTGSLETPNGTVPVAFEFKADGTSLSGSTTGPDGTPTAFKDGKIEGNKITFTVNLDFGGMPLVIAYTGTVSPEKIDLKAEVFGMPFEFSVTKAKN
jgi:hypothetical protein